MTNDTILLTFQRKYSVDYVFIKMLLLRPTFCLACNDIKCTILKLSVAMASHNILLLFWNILLWNNVYKRSRGILKLDENQCISVDVRLSDLKPRKVYNTQRWNRMFSLHFFFVCLNLLSRVVWDFFLFFFSFPHVHVLSRCNWTYQEGMKGD